jgi:hypothetical protein
MHANGETDTSQGTVNIALANANGIILLTDSVGSHREANAWHPLPQPAQKLFRLDDKTVCSIAGFASETGWVPPQLNTEVAGIIAVFQDQLSKKPVAELEVKLKAIGFLVGFYIDLVANRREVTFGAGTPIDYIFQVIVAGYDADGKPKLEKLVLAPVVLQATDGHRYWSHTTSLEVSQVGQKLVFLLGGIPNVSREVLDSPQKFRGNEVVRKYIRAKKHDGGESLTFDEMAALASYMAAQTAKRYPSVVGGSDQVAILRDGKILKLDQPHFPDPPRPMKFVVIMDLKVQGAMNFATTEPDTHFVWIRMQFVGIRNPRLRLDGQFFYGCEIRDSIVEYGGGLTGFTPENKNTVVNTMMLPGGPPSGPAVSQKEMFRILNAFQWTDEPATTPPLPPTIGPK